MKAYIVLEDGKVFEGKSFGAAGEAIGETAVFTDMVGYQEILCDSANQGKAVVMTYVEIGNSGVSKEASQRKITVSGIIVKNYGDFPSNHTSVMSLADFLKQNNTIGISGIDTRELTRYVREKTMKAVMFAGNTAPDFASLAAKAKAA